MFKRNIKKVTLFFAIVITLFSVHAGAESIFLNDGKIIKGSVVTDRASSITVKTDQGKRIVIQRKDILRVLYTDISMGKVNIQMRNGSTLEVYIVNEDQKEYTVRKKLMDTREMKIPRRMVLFVTERNPTGLKGNAGTRSANLRWYAPYNRISHYIIYKKIKGPGDFQKAAITPGTSHILYGLKSNTDYIFKVTAVDTKGEESLSTNLLHITTKNIPPAAPRFLPATESKFSKKTNTWNVTWAQVKDIDGRVKSYRIYGRKNNKLVLLKETTKTSFNARRVDASDGIYVSAVDNDNDESPRARLLPKEINLTFSPGALFPLGDINSLGTGAGARLSSTLTGYGAPGLILALEAGFYSFFPRATEVSGFSFFTTGVFNIGYRFAINHIFSISLYGGLGAGYLSVNPAYSGLKDIAQVGFFGQVNLSLDLRLSDIVAMELHGSAGILAPGDIRFFASASLGFRFRFDPSGEDSRTGRGEDK